MRHRVNFLSWFVVIAATALLLAGCGGDESAPEAEEGAETGQATESAESLTIDFAISTSTFSANWYPYAAAQELGYFEDENLTVDLVFGEGSGSVTEQIAAGNLALGAPSMGAVIEARGAGLDVVDYYTMSYLFAFGIWVLEDSEIQDVSDLEGKRVGITAPGGGETAVVTAALGAAEIDPVTGVTLIPIGEGEATTVAALQEGRVDAYAASRFDQYALLVAGVELREITPPEFEELPGRGLITTPEQIEDNREALVRFGRAYAKATLFCMHNKEACEEFTRTVGPEQWVDTNTAGDSQGSLVYEEEWATHEVPEGELFGRHNQEAMQEFIDLIALGSETFEPFDPSELMVDDLLEEINDFDQDEVIAEAESFGG